MKPIIKNKKQIKGIRKSCRLAANTLKFAEKIMKSGMKSEDLDNEIREYIYSHGGIPATLGYQNYKKSCCISVNEVVCHGVPDSRKFQNGDIVKVDVATILKGYYGDNCSTFVVGEVTQEASELMRVAKECLYKGIEICGPNVKISKIGEVIQSHAENHGFSVVYQYAGHGVGCQFHEAPSISHTAEGNIDINMEPGWIFTIEPMINQGQPATVLNEVDGWTVSTIDGKLSAQYEHTVLIKENGYEILTLSDEE